jgi:predicted transcriptional regulator
MKCPKCKSENIITDIAECFDCGNIWKSHGGKRKGAGAKHKYFEPTTTMSFRVPISKTEIIKKIVTIQLHKYRKHE